MLINETIQSQIFIEASTSEVWDALVNPEKIEKYMFGTQAISQWKPGSELVFQGQYQGKDYTDKGVIQEIIPENILQYTYLSSFSGLADNTENYSLITFEINYLEKKVLLKVTQKGFLNLESKQHSKQNWIQILNSIKQLVESN